MKCLVDSYGLQMAEVARQVGVSTSGISKALRRADKSFNLVNNVSYIAPLLLQDLSYDGRDIANLVFT